MNYITSKALGRTAQQELFRVSGYIFSKGQLMPYYGRKKLTPEQRAELYKKNGGLLTEAEQDEILKLVYQGVDQTDAILKVHRAYETLVNTKMADAEFAAELEKATIAANVPQMEKALRKLAYGEYELEERVEVPCFDENYDPVLDKDGNPVFRVKSRKYKKVKGDNLAMNLWLKCNQPEKYDPVQRVELNGRLGDELTPEEARQALFDSWAETLGKKCPPNAPETS